MYHHLIEFLPIILSFSVSVKANFRLTDCTKYVNLFVINAEMGSFPPKTSSENSRLVQGCVVWCGLSPRSMVFERALFMHVIASQSADWCGNLLRFDALVGNHGSARYSFQVPEREFRWYRGNFRPELLLRAFFIVNNSKECKLLWPENYPRCMSLSRLRNASTKCGNRAASSSPMAIPIPSPLPSSCPLPMLPVSCTWVTPWTQPCRIP